MLTFTRMRHDIMYGLYGFRLDLKIEICFKKISTKYGPCSSHKLRQVLYTVEKCRLVEEGRGTMLLLTLGQRYTECNTLCNKNVFTFISFGFLELP